MFWLIGAALFAAAVYYLLHNKYNYWTKRGVVQGNPKFIFGDNWGTVIRKQAMAEVVQMVYQYGGDKTRYSGSYQFVNPILVLKDVELIKQITVKDFDHFMDHRVVVPEDVDPLWGRHLFALTGKRWREMRTTLSPAFTSSKMKFMFSLISKSGQQFIDYYLKQDQSLISVEMKDSFTRFTTDVIANVVFGVECDSLRDRDNDFYVKVKEATDLGGLVQVLRFIFYLTLPQIASFLRISMFSQKLSAFFSKVVKTNIESREKHGIVRPDMVHILLETRKSGPRHDEPQTGQDTGYATVEESEIHNTTKKAEITNDDITSQALVFFFAGYESVSNLMCFMAYELGVNPLIQERLIEEVDRTDKTCDGNLTYEALLGMKYMDMIVCESLRKWPNVSTVDRVCIKAYTIEPKLPDEKPVHLRPGDSLWLPIFGLHRDERYWPEPEKFDPERFSDENKHRIVPYSYIPFGAGPRNCIASRFALLETKALFFYILKHFEIVPIQKSQIPLRICKKQINMTAEDGFWFGLKRRDIK